jgi:hypothetical protein
MVQSVALEQVEEMETSYKVIDELRELSEVLNRS